ncbi:MAG: flavin reductase family protein [Gammaproteobacteria bacterium]|nr:flavin reductase family protein [Gammaproteobacteria bacterium]
MKNFGNKPFMYPQPVLMIGTYDENEKPNLMNAAWGSISNDDEISICLSTNHKTCKNFEKTHALTVSMATKRFVKECDYLGIQSGNKVDKIEKINFHSFKAPHVNAPLFEELPLSLECEVLSYDHDSCRLRARIVNVIAQDSILNEDGNVDPKLLEPITFDPFNNEYLVLGEAVGKAFSCGKEFIK